MKKIYAIGIAFLSLFSFSCSEWMDIRPSTEVEADVLFTNEDGFKSALTGVYARMIGENLYGNQLTFGLLEDLAQRYDAGLRYNTLDANSRALFYEYDEEDYQNSWKKYLFPEKVSEKFVVKPTWREYTPEADELIIELDPGRAFGTGSHPTTSLCLKLMEENISEGDSVIDVGTGSGILMIAADRLGASEIYGTDIDELAVESAKENLELNNISEDKAKVYKGDLISVVENKKFDVVVANILADVLLILLHDISKVVKPNGKIIFSGIIEDKCELLRREVESLGFTVEEIKVDKEWRAMLIKA